MMLTHMMGGLLISYSITEYPLASHVAKSFNFLNCNKLWGQQGISLGKNKVTTATIPCLQQNVWKYILE